MIRRSQFNESQNDELLASHTQCKRLVKKKYKKRSPLLEQFKSSSIVTKMLNSFSERNGLNYVLTLDSLMLVYKICIYEDAILGHSPWCTLLTNKELSLIEYMLDIEEYHDAHGRLSLPSAVYYCH